MSFGKQSISRCTLGALSALVMVGVVSGHAAAKETKTDEFTLNPMIVTAQRYLKSDLTTPASTKVYTSDQLQATGANTVVEALKFAEGIIYHAQGPAGQSQGGMTSKVFIRGQDRGTLVLVDGIPLNLRGSFSLEDMPVDDVERIEIIRGGGSVMYGSNATGGVINIITKTERANSAQVAFGNYGKEKHAVSFQAGRLGVGFSFEKLGEIERISAPSTRGTVSRYYDFLGSEKHMLSYNYRFNDNWIFSQSYSENSYANRYNHANKNAVDSETDYDTTHNRINLRYNNDNGWQGSAYLNYRHLHNDKLTYSYSTSSQTTPTKTEYTTSDVKDQVVGLDLQKDWLHKQEKYMVGLSIQNESYKQVQKPETKDVSRNVYSLFAQWNHPFNEYTDITLSARETWTGGAPDNKNYNEFTPQVQLLHKLDAATSWYVSAGKSFSMPTFSQIYGNSINILGNPNVEPEIGKHYETGLKHISGLHSWKLAVFKTNIENYITTSTQTDPWFVKNEDTKNTGIELSCEIAGNNGWSSTWGISYANPQFRELDTKTGVITDWQRQYGRLQFNGGINYRQDKWNASLQGNYLGKRILSSDKSAVNPLFTTALHVSYKPTTQQQIYLNVDNVLNRKDITTHSSSRYYAMPINFELGYRMSF